MEEFIAFMVELCEFIIGMLFESYYDVCLGTWYEAFGGFNPGQMEIAGNNIIPAIEDYMADAAEPWAYESEPEGVDPGEYIEAVYDSYDGDVIDRAFSDTMYAPYDEMEAIWEHAIYVQYVMEAFEAMDFLDFDE